MHTVTIRKGKIAKPNEFGSLVTIQEAEHQIVTAYEIHAARPADVTLWTPASDRHQAIFGHAQDLAAGDRGFSSPGNEQAAVDRGDWVGLGLVPATDTFQVSPSVPVIRLPETLAEMLCVSRRISRTAPLEHAL